MNDTQFLTTEDFFIANQKLFNSTFDTETQDLAMSIRDQNIEKYDDLISAAIKLEEKIRQKIEEMNCDFEWVVRVQERHTSIGFRHWIDHLVEKAQNTFPLKLNDWDQDPSIHFLIEQNYTFGTQMEELHHAKWAKDRIEGLWSYKPESFEQLEPMIINKHTPITQVARILDQDLESGVNGGMRNPYACSLAVGSVWIRVKNKETQEIREIPLIRFIKTTEFERVIHILKQEVEQHHKALKNALQDNRKMLDLIPENWPSEELYKVIQEWRTKMYLGDRGLMGSDFFEENWVGSLKGKDISRKLTPTEEVELQNIIQNNEMKRMEERLAKRKQSSGIKSSRSLRV